jgi:hypothetical protein
MGKFNEELRKAGVRLAGDGLKPLLIWPTGIAKTLIVGFPHGLDSLKQTCVYT